MQYIYQMQFPENSLWCADARLWHTPRKLIKFLRSQNQTQKHKCFTHTTSVNLSQIKGKGEASVSPCQLLPNPCQCHFLDYNSSLCVVGLIYSKHDVQLCFSSKGHTRYQSNIYWELLCTHWGFSHFGKAVLTHFTGTYISHILTNYTDIIPVV